MIEPPAFWQAFEPSRGDGPPWTDRYAALMPDGRRLVLPLRDFGDFAVAGFIANQASFAVLDQVAAWTAAAAAGFGAEVVVGLPTLGHAVGAAVARALGHSGWVAPSTTRKRWYDDAFSVPLGSITGPAVGANAGRRMWLDPRLVGRLRGRRVLLVDDVISTGSSALAGLALLRLVGVEPVGVAVAMMQGDVWRGVWPGGIGVVGGLRRRGFGGGLGGGWLMVRAAGSARLVRARRLHVMKCRSKRATSMTAMSAVPWEDRMTSTATIIEVSARDIADELRRQGIGPEERVTLTIEPELFPGRRESRRLVIAAGLDDDDIDRLIAQAREEVAPRLE